MQFSNGLGETPQRIVQLTNSNFLILCNQYILGCQYKSLVDKLEDEEEENFRDMGKTITISVNSEYVILNKGYRDYKILDFMERIALSLSLDNFLYIISFSGNRERVVDRIQLMTKSKYDSFSIALYDFNKNSKIVVILSNKGRLFCINLRENYKFKCIREVKFKKTRLNTTLNCVWKLKDGSGYFVLHKR